MAYLPGPKILSLAGRALRRIDISAIAQPFVDDLVDEVRCTVHVPVVNGDEIVYLIRADSDKPYQMPSRVGQAIPLHTSGIGKAVLSGYNDHGSSASPPGPGLPPRTTTPSPPSRGCAPRSRKSDVGYALDREENVPGVICVAAPILDSTHKIT